MARQIKIKIRNSISNISVIAGPLVEEVKENNKLYWNIVQADSSAQKEDCEKKIMNKRKIMKIRRS